MLAHELGHHVYRHMVKGIVVQGVVAFFGFWCLKLTIRWAAFDWKRYDQIDFANLPLMILVDDGHLGSAAAGAQRLLTLQ